MEDEKVKVEFILSASIFVIGIILLLSIGGNIGWILFGVILLIASLVMLWVSDTNIGLYSLTIFWIISEYALVKGIIDFTGNNLYGGIVGIIVFLIVIIPIYLQLKD